MKTLSLWQPHALAIGIGLKPWETRGWWTDYRGPMAVHAAKRPWTDEGPWHSRARQILQDYVAKHGPVAWDFGAVICTADLVDCVRTSGLRGRIPAQHEFWGDFSDGEDGRGRWAFKLENVKMLAQPIQVRGMQGWFDIDLGAEERRAAPAQNQLGLFDLFQSGPSAPGLADPEEIPAGSQVDRDTATDQRLEPAGDIDEGADGASAVLGQAVEVPAPAELEVDHDAHAFRSVPQALTDYIREQEQALARVEAFSAACDAGGFQFRGYSGDAGGGRTYTYSRRGAPGTVFYVAETRWDGTPESLARRAAEVRL